MSTETRIGPHSFADFLELIHEDQKANLIEGTIYMASPESLEHNDLVRWFTTLLSIIVDDRTLGRVTVNKVAFRLTPRTVPEADVAFIRQDRLHVLRSDYVDGPPDLAIEIVSSESVDCDYEHKRHAYEAAGVAEYWIVDPAESKATFLLHAEGGFREIVMKDGLFESSTIPGFWVDVGWFWQRPMPSPLQCANMIISNPASH